MRVKSWLKGVERWFAEINRRQIRRDSFGSGEDLEKTIYQSLSGTRNLYPSVESHRRRHSRNGEPMQKIRRDRTLESTAKCLSHTVFN